MALTPPRLTLSKGNLKEEGLVYNFTSIRKTNNIVGPKRAEVQDQDLLLFFQNMPYDMFNKINDRHLISRHVSVYLEDIQTMKVRLPTLQHGSITGQFCTTIVLKVYEMGLRNKIISSLRATAHMGGVHQDADASWGLSILGKHYVTLTLEVGTSNLEQSLALDAHRWLESPDSHVHQVVTVIARPDRPMLTFQRWEGSRGEYSTRRVLRPRARVTQEATVWMEEGQMKCSGSLSIKFSKLFEREPRPGTNEGDMVFNEEDFWDIAQHAWRMAGHLPWPGEEEQEED